MTQRARLLWVGTAITFAVLGAAWIGISGASKQRERGPSALRSTDAPDLALRRGPPAGGRSPESAPVIAEDEGEDVALATWLRHLDAKDRAERGAALVRLRTLGPRAAPGADRILRVFLEGDADLDALAMATLAALGREGDQAIETALVSVDDRIRAGAVATLSRMKEITPRMREAVSAALADPAEGVRAAAASTWAVHHDPEASLASKVTALLDDPRTKVRAAAARSLGSLQASPEDVVPTMARRLLVPGETTETRCELAWALMRYGAAGAPAAATLAEVADGGDPIVAREAFRALAALGPNAAQAVPILVRASDQPEEPRRSHALAALAAVAGDSPDVAIRLVEVLRPTDLAARAVLEGLVGGGDRSRGVLRAVSTQAEGRALIDEAVITVPRGQRQESVRRGLLRLVGDEDDGLSSLGLRSLAAAGPLPPEGLRDVLAAMKQAPPRRAAEFANALGQVADDSPEAATALLEIARGGDPVARAAAVRSLGLVDAGHAEALAYLRAIAAGEDEGLAKEAKRALRRLGEGRVSQEGTSGPGAGG